MKRMICSLMSLFMVFGMLVGCTQQEAQQTPAVTAEQTASNESATGASGKATASAQGYGGEVTITIEVTDGKITDFSAVGDSETQGVGSTAIDTLPGKIIEAGNLNVDVVSGATMTSNAILSAGRTAYAEITGESAAEAAMAPGTYNGEGTGFYKPEPVQVSVTVSENEILSIEVSTDNGETGPILQSAIDLMVPRMIEHQSISVDAITGATASSNAIRQGVTAALSEAIVQGGADASAIDLFQKAPEKTGGNETIETDILVVGMGGAGTAAAIRAAQLSNESGGDITVLAIDKAGKYGGTSANTTGMMAINPEKYAEEFNGGNDYMDKEALREAWITYTEGDAKTEVIDLMLNYSGTTMDWLVYDLGFAFEGPNRGFTATDVYDCWFAYTPYNHRNYAEIGVFYDNAYAKYEQWGGQYMLETEAYELLFNSTGEKVTGVKARNLYDGTEYEIHADEVILSTGGFAGNGEMETEYLGDQYYPLKGEWKLYGMYQNDGKMIESAIQNGLGTYNIEVPPMVHLAGTPTLTGFEVHIVEGEVSTVTGRIAAWSAGDLPMHMAISPDSLAVDTNGKRFASEEGVAMLDPWIAGPHFYSIWSDDRVQSIKTNGLEVQLSGPSVNFLGHTYPIPMGTALPETEEVLQAGIDAGFVHKADTLAELAALIGVDAPTLEATVSDYNGYCENGIDPEFGKVAENLKPVSGEGPFYAITCYPYCYCTTGALNIDENLNVLKADGVTTVGNLYAAGLDSSGVLFTDKKAYVTYGAAAQGWCYTSGYLCGEAAIGNLTVNKKSLF